MSSHPAGTRALVTGLCTLALILEGYDLLMYGTVVPSLLAYEAWDLGPGQVGLFGSLSGVGMLVGALIAAAVTDRWGRRRSLLTAVMTFSVAMALCAVAPGPAVFGLGRALIGLGAGVLMPTAAALLIEYAAPGTRARMVAFGFVGTSIGGILAAALSIWVVPAFGFRAMFVCGVVPAALLLPALFRWLPESPSLRRHSSRATAAGADDDAPGIETVRRTEMLFGRTRTRATVLFWAMTGLCLLVLFGVATWLPAVMRSAGYPLGAALSFLLVLNIGGIVGSLGGAILADRYGIRPVTAGLFVCAAGALTAIAATPPLSVIYLFVLLAGAGTTGTQILLNTYIGGFYPPEARATGLGLALGVGRIGAIVGPSYGAYFVALDAGSTIQLLAFAAPAALGAALTVAVPAALTRSTTPDTSAVDVGRRPKAAS